MRSSILVWNIRALENFYPDVECGNLLLQFDILEDYFHKLIRIYQKGFAQ